MIYRLLPITLLVIFNSFALQAEEKSTAYLMTTSDSILGNISTLHIINTHTASQNFTATIYQESGAQVGDSRVQLNVSAVPPNGRLVLTSSELETIFSIGPWSGGPAVVEVFASNEFKLMSKLQSPSGFISNSNCVTESAVYNIEGFEQPDLTFIRFINTGSNSITGITGNLYNQNGENIGGADVTLLDNLAAKQQVWIQRNDLANLFGEQWNGEATLVVSDQSNLKLLNLNFVNSETFFNFSCIETSSPVVAEDVTLSTLQSTIFTPSCAVSGCHTGSFPPQGLNLSDGQTFSNTVGVASTEFPSLKRIEAGDADNSYLVQKLEGTAAVGSRMPFGQSALSNDQIQNIRTWISQGAANN